MDKEHMTAFFLAKNEIKAVEDHEMQKEIERLKAKGSKK